MFDSKSSEESSHLEGYYFLNSEDTDPKRIQHERDKARKIKKTKGWQAQLQRGICHYCNQKFSSSELTMDHVVPLARGGQSKPSNLVTACRACNQEKKLHTPVDQILRRLKNGG